MRAGILAGSLFVIAVIGSAVVFSTPRGDPGVASVKAPFNVTSKTGRLALTQQQTAQAIRSGLWPTPVLSLLAIDRPMSYGEWRWDDRNVPPGPVSVRVDLTTQLISVLRSGHEVGAAVIVFGSDGHDTPIGRFPILARSERYRSITYDAPMPYALRLTADGVALHGSDVRLGRATHGCIGLPIEFARKLFSETHLGDIVMIVRSRSAKYS